MAERKVFTVHSWPDGKYWIFRVDGIDSASQSRGVRDLEAMAKDFISSMTEIPETDFEIEITFHLSPEVEESLANAAKLQAEAATARAAAAAESRKAAVALKKSGLSVRDVGAVLGISFQRAHQLIKG